MLSLPLQKEGRTPGVRPSPFHGVITVTPPLKNTPRSQVSKGISTGCRAAAGALTEHEGGPVGRVARKDLSCPRLRTRTERDGCCVRPGSRRIAGHSAAVKGLAECPEVSTKLLRGRASRMPDEFKIAEKQINRLNPLENKDSEPYPGDLKFSS